MFKLRYGITDAPRRGASMTKMPIIELDRWNTIYTFENVSVWSFAVADGFTTILLMPNLIWVFLI